MSRCDAEAAVRDDHERVTRFSEHGQEWITCSTCGAIWSVVQCVSEVGEEYEDLEVIDAGDDSCLDAAEVLP